MSVQLENMAQPNIPATEYQLTFYDGLSRIVYDTGVERPFPDGKLIVSRTDLTGILTHANDAFIEISGYSQEELIGKPQHILRHPDMPAPVFKQMWEIISSKQKWHGYVKNLCKDGSHYWVYATIVPNVRRGEVVGYTSVRRKPSRSKIVEAAALYARIRAGEN